MVLRTIYVIPTDIWLYLKDQSRCYMLGFGCRQWIMVVYFGWYQKYVGKWNNGFLAWSGTYMSIKWLHSSNVVCCIQRLHLMGWKMLKSWWNMSEPSSRVSKWLQWWYQDVSRRGKSRLPTLKYTVNRYSLCRYVPLYILLHFTYEIRAFRKSALDTQLRSDKYFGNIVLVGNYSTFASTWLLSAA